MEQNERTQNIRPLNSEERQAAREKARDQVIRRHGKQPELADFYSQSISRFPPWIRRLVSGLLVLGLLAAFTFSMFRVYSIARTTFLETIADPVQAAIVGAAAVALGEIMIIIAMLARSVFDIRRSVVLGTAFAAFLFTLTANVTVANPHTFFGGLEAVLPPLFTIVLAYVLERLALESVRDRHETNQLYQAAMNEYRTKTAAPEADADWMQVYANALRDALRKKNSRRTEALEILTHTDWRALIDAELEAENWYQEVRQESTTEAQMPPIAANEPKPAVLSIIRWFEAHPEAWETANPAIALQTNVSRETVRQARKWIERGYKNGHGEVEKS